MEVAIHLPDDVAAAVPWEDVPRHLVENIALEGYQEGWLSEEQVRRWGCKVVRGKGGAGPMGCTRGGCQSGVVGR